MTSEDWVVGIAEDVRRLALAGVSDEVLQAFIDARRRGDTELAARLLSLAAHRSHSTAPAMTAMERLRVAALRPVVNSLDPPTLYAYVGILWPLSDEVVRSHEDPRHWTSEAFVEAIAQRLMHVALEQIHQCIERGASSALH